MCVECVLCARPSAVCDALGLIQSSPRPTGKCCFHAHVTDQKLKFRGKVVAQAHVNMWWRQAADSGRLAPERRTHLCGI